MTTVTIIRDGELTEVPYESVFPAIAPPVLTRVSRYDVIGRLTDVEGDLLLAAFNEAPGKLRFMWDSIQYVDHTDPNYQTLWNFIASVLGSTRADQILVAVE